MDIPLGKFPDFQLHPPGKKLKDSHAAFPVLGKAPGWIWISRRPGFGSYSQNFSPAAPPRFPNPSRSLTRHSLDVPVTSLGHSQPLPTPPGASQSLWPEAQTFPGYPYPGDPAEGSSLRIPRESRIPWMHQTPRNPRHSQSPLPCSGTAPAPGKP